MRADWERLFNECYDFICLNGILYSCYESCMTADEENECYSMCNELYEQRARELE